MIDCDNVQGLVLGWVNEVKYRKKRDQGTERPRYDIPKNMVEFTDLE